jgi:hypothetical protein
MRGRELVVAIGVALVLVVTVVVVEQVGHRPSAASVASGRPPTLPLVAATTTPGLASVLIPMGHLYDPTNTFWQVFLSSGGAGGWTLHTPLGVADNGGLEAATSATGQLVVGFLPSAQLTFSPVTSTADSGASWTEGQLPQGLAAVADGLAVGPTGNLLGLVSRDGQTVLSSPGGLSSWTPIASTTTLARSAPGCGLSAITAVAFWPSGRPVIGTDCATGGAVGLLAPDGSTIGSPGSDSDSDSVSWESTGPRLAGVGPTVSTSVIRLVSTGSGLVGLASSRSGSATSLVAFWNQGTPDRWMASTPTPVAPGWTVAATGVGGAGGRAVTVLFESGDRRQVDQISGPGGSWSRLPTPPAGTGAVAAAGTETDAFVASGKSLSVWTLPPGATGWSRSATMTVPVPYGSSN